MSERRIHVAHIVPAMDIGGVEIGISRSIADINREFIYEVYYVRRKGVLKVGQRSVLRLLKTIILQGNKPDIIITSLWWSHFFGWVMRSRKRQWVAFFHSAGFFHRLDLIVCRWAWRQADKCLVDSIATQASMLNNQNQPIRHPSKPYAVIPYIFEGHDSLKPWSDRTIDIIWVGRNHPGKRVDILVRFIRFWSELQPKSRIVVIYSGDTPTQLAPFTPDYGDGVNRPLITLLKNASPQQVQNLLTDSRFFVLFSDQEGMSMSTVEAIQAGCVPVARPVGEIPRYLDERAAILVPGVSDRELRDIAKRMKDMLSDVPRASALTQRAQQNIGAFPKYTDSLIRALKAIKASTRSLD